MSTERSKRYIYLPLAFAVVLAGGILLGNRLTRVTGNKADNILFLKPENHDKLSEIINYIQQDYVDSVNRNELTENAINGILEQLDPHSQYIPAADFHEVNDPLNGNFEGIGIQFRIEKDTIMVVQTIPGGPSERAGLRAGDRIVMINDTLMAGIQVENRDAVRKLKGKRGTEVTVSVFRRGVNGLIDFTIIRDVIPTYSIDISYMVDETIGYIKFNKFATTTYEEFLEALKDLQSQGMKKLIIDLRGNYGGYLQAAINMADEFLGDKKLIVYTEGNNRPNKYAYATSKGLFEEQPLVILIDEASASASEIIAGAVQDNDRGLVVGRRSFGKGLVQEQLSFPDGSAIRLTVARYHTPTGRNIQRPYEKGAQEYYHELFERYTSGEMEDPDSVMFNDSLKYTTPGGKVVYGGGGIMPDIYVSLKADDRDKFYNELVRKNIIFQFAFDYTDRNRSVLSGFGSLDNFEEGFSVTPAMFEELIDFAREEGISGTKKEISDSERKIKLLLKAYISRNVLDDAGFYPIYHRLDKVFLTAVDTLRKIN